MGNHTRCADCDDRTCRDGEDCPGIAEEILERYRDPEILAITKTAAALEGNHYMKKTRLEEVIQFAQDMGYDHLGVAFCIGFADEARILADLLERRFRVTSVCCKVCGIEKDRLGLVKIRKGEPETMCNPIGQAAVLNEAGTRLNILLGLCVGHDILFTRHCSAPVTTLVVKDRPLGHNPAAALYSRYLRNRLIRALDGE